eukprot:scaffold3416_cov185-Amphora_coffeaeformis.AAC.2
MVSLSKTATGVVFLTVLAIVRQLGIEYRRTLDPLANHPPYRIEEKEHSNLDAEKQLNEVNRIISDAEAQPLDETNITFSDLQTQPKQPTETHGIVNDDVHTQLITCSSRNCSIN